MTITLMLWWALFLQLVLHRGGASYGAIVKLVRWFKRGGSRFAFPSLVDEGSTEDDCGGARLLTSVLVLQDLSFEGFPSWLIPPADQWSGRLRRERRRVFSTRWWCGWLDP